MFVPSKIDLQFQQTEFDSEESLSLLLVTYILHRESSAHVKRFYGTVIQSHICLEIEIGKGIM